MVIIKQIILRIQKTIPDIHSHSTKRDIPNTKSKTVTNAHSIAKAIKSKVITIIIFNTSFLLITHILYHTFGILSIPQIVNNL